MTEIKGENLRIVLNKTGAKRYAKVSYPARFGVYSEIETPEYLYQFNLKGEIRFVQGRGSAWPRDEWLKRTAGNDWVYYTPGVYTGLFSFIGEYYLPCFVYHSNSIFAYRPFENASVERAIESVDELAQGLAALPRDDLEPPVSDFLDLVMGNRRGTLAAKAERFHDSIGGPVRVLPPDTRHVDYDVIPIVIADGCLYNCDFCMIKDGKEFAPRSREDIDEQIESLKDFYGSDISNYNSILLGQNDALNAGEDLIAYSLERAYEAFDFANSSLRGCNLFLFGSVDSFMRAGDDLFRYLNGSPCYTYINLGFESLDDETLDYLGKPLTVNEIRDAFAKMLDINRRFDRIEMTANFVFSDDLPEGHTPSILRLNEQLDGRASGKGGIYLSPLISPFNTGESNVELQKKFIGIKNALRLPVYLYLIQRL